MSSVSVVRFVSVVSFGSFGTVVPASPLRLQECLDAVLRSNGGAVRVDEAEMSEATLELAKLGAAAIGSPTVPNVKWDDVGGQEAAKRAILDTIELPMRAPVPIMPPPQLPRNFKEQSPFMAPDANAR